MPWFNAFGIFVGLIYGKAMSLEMENQYYRTFVGIPVRPGPGLLSLRDELMASFEKERISWVQPGLFHITLRFLGDTRTSSLSMIRETLRDVENIPPETEIHFDGIGSFGPRKGPRVIWAGFEDAELIDALKREVDLALEKCGIPCEEFSFNAHLTLGRVRGLKDLEAYYEKLKRLSPQLKEPVLLDRMVFYRSILGSGAPRYSTLEEYPFKNK